MNSPVMGLRVASVIFGLACLGQLTRLLMRFEIMIGGRYVQLRWSAVAVVITATLCIWLWRLSLPSKQSTASPTTPHTPRTAS